MSAAQMPYSSELAAAQNEGELQRLWGTFTQPASLSNIMQNLERQGIETNPDQLKGRMSADWGVRAAELRAAATTGPTQKEVVTAAQRLAEIDDQSYQATLDYGDAVQDYATKHAGHKKARAQKYMALKGTAAAEGGKLTDGMAETQSDADEAVAQLHFESELAEAKMKAAKAMLDHLQRSFDYHRSLFAREGRMDARG